MEGIVIFVKIQRRIKSRLYSALFFFRVVIQFFKLKLNNQQEHRFSLYFRDLQLCLSESTPNTGFDRHYIFHTAWASRIISEIKPEFHVDVASSLYFVVNVSAFVPVKFYDYRPVELNLSGVESYQGDLCALPFSSNSVRSLSCLHVVEHVGLGRYGDPLDYNGDVKAVMELKRVVASGGDLLIALPIGGRSRIKFNAHRIYTYNQVLEMFDGFVLKEFSLIPDNEVDGGLIRNATEAQSDAQRYGCGCFRFIKE